MEAKKINVYLNVFLWICFFAGVLGAYLMVKNFSIPMWVNYIEIPQQSEKYQYTYKDKYGEESNAERQEAWHHTIFSRPKPIMYDKQNDVKYTVNEEYLEEALKIWPPTEYPNLSQHFFWLYFILAIVIVALFVYYCIGYCTDVLLYSIIKNNPKFKDCVYYLNTDRLYRPNDIGSLLKETCPNYLKGKGSWRYPSYIESPHRICLDIIISRMFDNLCRTGSTKVSYMYTFVNNVVSQYKYLEALKNYWIHQAANPSMLEQAQNSIDAIEKEKTKKFYEHEKVKLSPLALEHHISKKLEDFFKIIIGDKIFTFTGRAVQESLLSNFEWGEYIRVKVVANNTTSWGYFDDYSSLYYPHLYCDYSIIFGFSKSLFIRKDYNIAQYTRSAEKSKNWTFSFPKNEGLDTTKFYTDLFNNAIDQVDFTK